MNPLVWKSALVALFSVATSLAIILYVIPALGLSHSGLLWASSAFCPLVLAWLAGAYTLQAERLKAAHREVSRAHAQLAAAHRRLTEKAARDDMTGMLNRESFFAQLDGSRGEHDRGALLIVDADHFKSINDTYGHLVGDEALLMIADAIRRGVRNGDVLGRIGGEEFAVLLGGAGEQEARRVAERIRLEVELLRFKPADERTLPLTVSVGGVVCASAMTVSELMREADRKLYEAKNGGRNQALVARPAAAA